MRRPAAILGLARALPSAGRAQAPVRMDDLPSISHAGIYIASERGFFTEWAPRSCGATGAGPADRVE